jgi:tRNA(Ile)-lysidine synthase
MTAEEPLEHASRNVAECREARERGIVVAVSGGIDSITLLHLCARHSRKTDISVLAAHYDHGIRGEQSRADSEFVAGLCREWGIECRIERRDIPALHRSEGGNLESLARRERYRFLGEIARSGGNRLVLTGHTADDRVETMLMNLLRGAGPRGLAGIRERGSIAGLPVFRPLLGVWRTEIEAYARNQGLPFREDVTNRDTRFLRNWVRLRLLPRMEKRKPSVKTILLRQAHLFESEDRYLTAESVRFVGKHGEEPRTGEISLPVVKIADQEPWLLHGVLRECFERSHRPARIRHADTIHETARMLEGERTTWSLDLPGGFHVRREYDRLIFGPPPEATPWEPINLPVPGRIEIPGPGIEMTVEEIPAEKAGPQEQRSEGEDVVSFDLDRLPGPLCVRAMRPGDRIRPRGMEGTQKVKQILADRKVPKRERPLVPILCAGDQPVWVVGHRLDGRYTVTEDTGRAVRVTVRRKR